MEDLKELILGRATADAVVRLFGLLLIASVTVAIVWATVHARATRPLASTDVTPLGLIEEGELHP